MKSTSLLHRLVGGRLRSCPQSILIRSNVLPKDHSPPSEQNLYDKDEAQSSFTFQLIDNMSDDNSGGRQNVLPQNREQPLTGGIDTIRNSMIRQATRAYQDLLQRSALSCLMNNIDDCCDEQPSRSFLRRYFELCLSANVGVSLLVVSPNTASVVEAWMSLVSHEETWIFQLESTHATDSNSNSVDGGNRSKNDDDNNNDDIDNDESLSNLVVSVLEYGLIVWVHGPESEEVNRWKRSNGHHLQSTFTRVRTAEMTHDVLATQFLTGQQYPIMYYAPALNRQLSCIDIEPLLTMDRHEANVVDGASPRIIKLVYPGSFNPLHIGHSKLMHVAHGIIQARYPNSVILPIFELSADNVDKPSLNEPEIRHRIKQFAVCDSSVDSTSDPSTRTMLSESNLDNMLVAITRAPLFITKAQLLPGSVFVIGMDTAVRLIDTKYYDYSMDKMMNALSQFETLHCSFLVAGRQKQKDEYDKTFQTLSDLNLDHVGRYKHLFMEISERDFRVDLSSSEIRSQAA